MLWHNSCNSPKAQKLNTSSSRDVNVIYYNEQLLQWKTLQQTTANLPNICEHTVRAREIKARFSVSSFVIRRAAQTCAVSKVEIATQYT